MSGSAALAIAYAQGNRIRSESTVPTLVRSNSTSQPVMPSPLTASAKVRIASTTSLISATVSSKAAFSGSIADA